MTLLRRGERIGERVGPSTRWALLAELRQDGVAFETGVAYVRIEPGALWIRDAAGQTRAIPADTVVVAAGQRSERSLADALHRRRVPHLVIGGADRADELDAERAFRQGAQTPAAVARLIGSRA